MRKRISTGSPFEETAGYSRAVVAGNWCFVSGTTGYDYASMAMPDDVATQCRNALATIDRALDEAGYDGWIGAEYTPLTSTEAGLRWLRSA